MDKTVVKIGKREEEGNIYIMDNFLKLFVQILKSILWNIDAEWWLQCLNQSISWWCRLINTDIS